MVKGLNTFGPINWKRYYNWHPDYLALLALKPCGSCPYEQKCYRSLKECDTWQNWWRTVWLEITEGIKRAAPELEPPKAANEMEFALIVTGAEENVKEGQDGLLH